MHVEYLKKLLTPGVIGYYRSFEVTEILGFHDDAPKTPVNFLSLLVAERAQSVVGSGDKPKFLNDQRRLVLKGSSWQFGIARYRISNDRLTEAVHRFADSGEWKPSGLPLTIGELIPLPPQYIPSDSSHPHAWNGILKNNFWDGSYVMELFDSKKEHVRLLLENPTSLAWLAGEIQRYVPIGIDGLSDRLGNVLIQFPVTVLTTEVTSSERGDFCIRPIWHQDARPRPLRISCEIYEDFTIEAYGSGTAIDAHGDSPAAKAHLACDIDKSFP